MNKFYLPIGDWSDDGHGVCEKFLIIADGNLEEIREAHFKIEEVTGVDIHSIANKYEENMVHSSVCLKLINLGLSINDYLGENYEDLNESNILENDDYYIESSDMAKLWIDLLNEVDSSLNIKLAETTEKIEMIPFYGHDEDKRHIDFVGYGTLG